MIRPEPDEDGHGIPFDEESRWKSQFRHAFLILGASAATVANRPGALELLVDALHDQERHWLQDDGLPADTFTPDYAQARTGDPWTPWSTPPRPTSTPRRPPPTRCGSNGPK